MKMANLKPESHFFRYHRALINKPKIDDGYGNIEKYPQLANKSKRNIKLIFNLLLMLKMAGG